MSDGTRQPRAGLINARVLVLCMKLDVLDIELSHKDKIKGIVLPRFISKDLAYLCGVLAGDGCIVDYQNQIFCVGNPKDEKEFYDYVICPLFKSLFNLKLKARSFKLAGTYGIRFDSKAIRIFLTDIVGLPRGKKYAKLKIPVSIKNNKPLLINYLSGLLDTDFGFSLGQNISGEKKYPQICFTSKSKKFCHEIYQTLLNLGINPSKVRRCNTFNKRSNKIYHWYKFNLCTRKEAISLSQILLTRQPKHLLKFNELKKYYK